MATHGLTKSLSGRLQQMERNGRLKGRESVVVGFVPSKDGRGPRFLIKDEGDKLFLRMNSNSYLGMALRSEIVEAEERELRLTTVRAPARFGLSAVPGHHMSRWSAGSPPSIAVQPPCCSRQPMPLSWGSFRRL